MCFSYAFNPKSVVFGPKTGFHQKPVFQSKNCSFHQKCGFHQKPWFSPKTTVFPASITTVFIKTMVFGENCGFPAKLESWGLRSFKRKTNKAVLAFLSLKSLSRKIRPCLCTESCSVHLLGLRCRGQFGLAPRWHGHTSARATEAVGNWSLPVKTVTAFREAFCYTAYRRWYAI